MTLARALPYAWYPVSFATAIAAFAGILAAGDSPAWAAYLPTMAIAFAIIVLEFRTPERPEWRPQWSDVSADAAFMTIIQVALPRMLAALSIVALAEWRQIHAPSEWWPHGWSLWAQVIAMVLAVDFMRYWVHRACHNVPLLWKLHEVHHSPDLLYVLNVGRFHPVEKVLHFCFDTVPFLLLGVAPEVIAGYFLMYSVNGLFQHSNVRLRYGWLNYLVGSAETHRWHHARDPKVANCNFGNTTIVWDLLFGTWYLPKSGAAPDIGITDKAYPKGFWAQMLTPFREIRLEPGQWVADVIMKASLSLCRRIEGRRLGAVLRDPMPVQRALLRSIVEKNRDTEFGRRHGFADIGSYEDFATRVPVSDYEALRPDIESEISTGAKALTADKPVRYVRTSGTTGKAKDIPLTRAHLNALRRVHRMSVAYQHRACPRAFDGSILAMVSPAFEGTLGNGRPFGSASGIVAGNTPAPVLEKFVLPPEALTVSDSRVKYLLALRLAIARRDITYLGSANSTTILVLMRLYREHFGSLSKDLREGGFFLMPELAPEVRAAVRPLLAPHPERAAELDRLGRSARIADLWPDLRVVVTWTCASAGVAVAALRPELPGRTRILELGYISSEFRGTFTLGRRAGSGMPTLETHFFEFVERDKWDAGSPEFLTLDRLRKGQQYYVIATTPSGLYRYFINDLVVVTAFLHETPLLKFLQKGKGVTNITGEKLYEAQVLSALQSAMSTIGRTSRFVMMLADEVSATYRLYVEPDAGNKPPASHLAQRVDAELQRLNVEYAAKRESGRLHPPTASWLNAQTGEAYKQHCVSRGQREGQFKTIALAYRKDFGFDLERFAEGAK
jgi:sterol desaturase/sphingolipid hydroxylase (fatty acid hydroxylase superfamily)